MLKDVLKISSKYFMKGYPGKNALPTWNCVLRFRSLESTIQALYPLFLLLVFALSWKRQPALEMLVTKNNDKEYSVCILILQNIISVLCAFIQNVMHINKMCTSFIINVTRDITLIKEQSARQWKSCFDIVKCWIVTHYIGFTCNYNQQEYKYQTV